MAAHKFVIEVTGPPKSGKTTLAIARAQDLLHRFSGREVSIEIHEVPNHQVDKYGCLIKQWEELN